MRNRAYTFGMFASFLLPSLAFAQPATLDDALEQATKGAIARVAPSVVQIRTVGGLEIIARGGQGVRKGLGPTSGVILSPDGYIISSSFNFAHKPSAILVAAPGAKDPLNAKIVAQDHTRMLTLLKVEANNLPVPATAPKSDIKLGQWTLAVGRTWSENLQAPPSVSVGIVSALDRIWGKAIQTDAKVSPVNYGGPLIDLQGRIMGILVPLSPRADDETAGVEWYDGGIGFAIPLEDIQRVLPKLKEGKDLKRGLLGITLQSRDQFSALPIVASVAFGSAAAKAGITPGDQIVEVDGKRVERYAQILHVLGNKYEGDRISLKVKRGDAVIDLPNIELTPPPSAQPVAFLGILPMRDDAEPGVEIRHVFPRSPAQQAGLKTGDRIVRIDKAPIPNRDQLLRRVASMPPNMEVALDVHRKGAEKDKTETIKVKLAEINDALPEDELPEGSLKKALAKPLPTTPPPGSRIPARRDEKPKEEKPKEEKPSAEKAKEEKKAPVGRITKDDPASGRSYWAYVPETYDPNISHGLVVWLHPAGDTMEAQITRVWRDVCQKHHLILFAPKADNPTGWLTSEADFIRADINALLKEYTIDRQRIVVHGLGNGGSLALYLGFDARDLMRGVAAMGAGLFSDVKDADPQQRLLFFLVGGGRDPEIEAIRAVRGRLQEKMHPVLYRELPEHGNGYVTDPATLRDLIQWIEALDRI